MTLQLSPREAEHIADALISHLRDQKRAEAEIRAADPNDPELTEPEVFEHLDIVAKVANQLQASLITLGWVKP